MPERRYTVSGQINLTDDEEEEDKKTPGRPNAWWAANKESIKEANEAAATFDGAVTGVRQGTHGGEAHVKQDDVTGSIDYCWCGLPFDHDWPGKERGRKHPREASGMSAAVSNQQQRIERRQLRAYNDDLVDVIVEAVNGYGARYRMQKNGLVLFPPDGTNGITMHARSSPNQVKQARLWFLRHCVGVAEDGKPVNPMVADREVLEEDQDRRHERVEAENRAEARETLEEIKQAPENPANRSLSEPVADDDSDVLAAARWVPYVDTSGETNEFFETDGTLYRCKVCLGTDHEYISDNTRGIGGHIRMNHRDTDNMRTEEALAKSLETRRLNRLQKKVLIALDVLSEAVGVTADTDQIEALKAGIKTLETENATLTKRAEEAEARLALIMEAARA